MLQLFVVLFFAPIIITVHYIIRVEYKDQHLKSFLFSMVFTVVLFCIPAFIYDVLVQSFIYIVIMAAVINLPATFVAYLMWRHFRKGKENIIKK